MPMQHEQTAHDAEPELVILGPEELDAAIAAGIECLLAGVLNAGAEWVPGGAYPASLLWERAAHSLQVVADMVDTDEQETYLAAVPSTYLEAVRPQLDRPGRRRDLVRMAFVSELAQAAKELIPLLARPEPAKTTPGRRGRGDRETP